MALEDIFLYYNTELNFFGYISNYNSPLQPDPRPKYQWEILGSQLVHYHYYRSYGKKKQRNK